eukprot:Gb_32387 [translate_table: standard]
MGGYLANTKMQQMHSPQEYVGMVVSNLTNAILTLYSKGARKFAFLGLLPLGCIPGMRSLANDPNGGCLEAVSSMSRAHNAAMSKEFKGLASVLPGLKIADSNLYDFMKDRLDNPSKYGFKEAVKVCCGGVSRCGEKKEMQEYELCENPKEYIWWDLYHPTERIHQQFAEVMWRGLDGYIQSINLQNLFHKEEPVVVIADEIDEL